MKTKKEHPSNSFLITIHHQEHHSYQGTIRWLDTNQIVHFRSERELLNLLHDATDHQAEQPLRCWQGSSSMEAI